MDPVLPFFLNQSPGMLRESKNLQKILDTKRAGEGGKTTLQVPSELLWRVKIGPKTLFLKKFKKLFNPKNPGNTRK